MLLHAGIVTFEYLYECPNDFYIAGLKRVTHRVVRYIPVHRIYEVLLVYYCTCARYTLAVRAGIIRTGIQILYEHEQAPSSQHNLDFAQQAHIIVVGIGAAAAAAAVARFLPASPRQGRLMWPTFRLELFQA